MRDDAGWDCVRLVFAKVEAKDCWAVLAHYFNFITESDSRNHDYPDCGTRGANSRATRSSVTGGGRRFASIPPGKH